MNPKHIVITGAGKGIGKAIAQRLHKEGHILYLCSRTMSDLEDLQSELLADRPNTPVHIKRCDVRNREELRAFGRWALSVSNDAIDVLVNNAGVYLGGPIMDEDEEQLPLMIETNLYSAYHLSRQIGKQMIQRAQGQIINICSIASQIAYPNGGSYSISKFAMLGLGKVLRAELKDHGIRVTNVLPGATWSNSWAGVDLPASRLMPAEDIAEIVHMCIALTAASVVEDIVVRPQLGDL